MAYPTVYSVQFTFYRVCIAVFCESMIVHFILRKKEKKSKPLHTSKAVLVKVTQTELTKGINMVWLFGMWYPPTCSIRWH